MTLSLLFSFFCFISMIDVQLANTCTHTNRVTVKKTKTNYEYCRRSPFSDRCGQIVYYNSSDWRRSTRCCTGWTGSQCDIPVCTNQKCQTNAFCVKKDDCFCRSSSIWNTACTVAKCSSSPYYTTNNDCFPGTCKTASSRECQCSSGFTGPNCRTMRDSPTFTKCQFSLLATSGGYEKVVFTGQCNSKEKLYSNARHITHVTVAWDTKYQVPEDVPSKPTYIRSYKFGITSADVQGSLKSNYGTTIDSISMKCSNQLIEASPVGMLTCSKSTYLGATTIRHGYSLQVTVKATSGGYKYVSGRLSFNGKSASQIASVTFDLEAPTHCDESYHCTHGNGPAVDMGQEFDRSTRSTHQLRWFGWNDSGSGLNTFSYKIYEMEPGISSLLTEKSQPVVTGSQTAFTTTYPTYSLPGPGMYSAVLKVTDNAGNVAAARRLMLWDPNSKVKLTDAPMSVQGKTPNDDDVVWLTFRPLGRFVAKWEGHFENAFHHNNKLLSGVKPWRAGLDDREGNLTVDAIPNVHGVVRFRFGHSDASGATPVTWEDVGLNQQFELGATLPFRMYVKAYDIMGNSATDTLGVGIDWTPPVVDGKRFSKNVDYSESKIPFSSRLSLTVSDKESGIRTIHYQVIDATDSSIIWRGEIAGQKAKQDKLSCQIDGSCVCTPFEECYRRNQVLHIDHCWLVHSVGHHVQVKAVIFNHVGLWTTTHVKLGVLDGLRGMNTCPKQLKATGRRLGAGAVVAIVIGVAWAVLLLTAFCLLGVFVMTRLRRHEPYAPRNFADFRRTLRQSVQFGNSASTNPGEFQLSSSRQQQSTIAFDNSSRQQQPPLREAGDGDDDDVEVYGYMVTDDVADWKIDAKKVVLGKRLPNSAGRFADIFEAMMKLTDVRQSAVAKKLKHGGNDESKLLMTAKMNFWATACPKHQNILHFIGAVTSGPILLFERCDLGRLRDWLIAQTQLTDELQDNMITFSIQIARAMKHLHENKIIHRRLGARNILLKSDEVGSVVAKVAGFGPMKGEVESSMNDRAEGKIPIKWMAPEQFNLVAGTKRSYDTKTDMWSFGVTLWEIFSKGEKPYPDCGIGELKALLSTGYRMPRPTHCPDMMYDQVVTPCWDSSATLRPSFADVVTVMETVFLHGGGGDEYFYEQSEAPPEPSNNTYEAAPNHGYDNNTYEATPEPDDDTYEPTQ